MSSAIVSATRDLPRLPPRQPDSHKGDYGRALLIGGSRGMAGAMGLAGHAALRGGAGLVRLAVPDAALDTIASYEPSYMTTPLPCDGEGRIAAGAQDRLVDLIPWATCVACGPGLGRSEELVELVTWLYRTVKQTLVVDADALHALSQRQEVLAAPGGPRILTPHPGEFRRFVDAVPATRTAEEDLAVAFAARHGVVLILKGHCSLITDGTRRATNRTGNPGMATGGTGDVLTGLTASLVCQGLGPFDAARLAAHVHGLAGDLAALEVGMVSLIASDLIRWLPAAFAKLG